MPVLDGLSGPFHKKFILCGTGILPVLENGATPKQAKKLSKPAPAETCFISTFQPLL
ncbi:hypothetical protein QUA60_06575 [Microcoleus sp. M2_D4]